ncbi:MAG: AraC family transcriptional regulator [Oscillospiraceae bacterium]|nr:AraC family transcriptional regulator [Oscillospiraceae bacterium]
MATSGVHTYKHGDIFFSCYTIEGTSCFHMCREHTLLYIYSGKLLIEDGERRIWIKKGECAFICRNHRITMHKLSAGKEAFSSVFINFKRTFLKEFYSQLDRSKLPSNRKRFRQNIIRMPHIPSIESLSVSLQPYFDTSFTPSDEIMNIKLVTGAYTLLQYDERFYPALFDFTNPWKIDILDFMDKNYMCELSIEDMAAFTGRSLATFKRDFRKVSDLSPERWLIRKRLEVARDKMLSEGKKPSEVYTEVGFKNLSHFYTAYKKQYGISPAK